MADETIEINDGLFPIEDGIAFTVQDGIHPQYDLRKLMSNTMRSRPQWEDFAKVASKVLYQEVERHRKALSMARTPENLDRALKITMLKMLGLDYRSDLLRDIDYDRALNTIALYNKTKGTEEFVRYMGFIKDAKFELARLWTTDYAEFVDGPAVGWQKVYDDPPGPWYPTAHVGLLYEEFSNKTEIDEDDLRALFYRMAPINLVLEWIASMLTASVGTLWLATNWWEETEDSREIRHDPKLFLYLYPGNVETTEDTLRTAPRGPYSIMYAGTQAQAFEQSVEKLNVRRGACDWSAATGPDDVSWAPQHYVERVIARNALGQYEGRTSPVYDEHRADRTLLGAQIVPERWNYVPGSDDPAAVAYARTNVTLSAPGAAVYIDGTPTRLVTSTNRGFITPTTVPLGRKAVTWKFRPNATSHVAIEGAGERVIVNVGSLLITKSHPTIWAEAEFERDGWIRISTRLDGPIKVYPAWGQTTGEHLAATGSIFWRRLQIENANYPSRASATANGLPLLRPATRWTLPGDQLNRAGGFFLMHFAVQYPEWEDGSLTLFEFIGSRSRLYARIGTDGRVTFGLLNGKYRHEMPESGQSMPGVILPREMNKLAVGWSKPDRRMSVYLNGWSLTRNDIDWPANFTGGGICRTFGSTVTYTSFVRRLTLVGVDDTSFVPAHSVLSHLTS